MIREEFMRKHINDAEGIVLNVGCHVDGPGLKNRETVLNCDVAVQEGYDYRVDVFFDAREPWPFEDDAVELVVLGDILEHFYDEEMVRVLSEARRVSQKVCITVPRDDLLADTIDFGPAYKSHCNTVSEDSMRYNLAQAGWYVTDFQTITDDPIWSPVGYLILGGRDLP